MRGQENNIKKQRHESTFQRIERMHPHKMLLYLGIVGSSLIFLFMIVAYTISKSQSIVMEGFVMPKAFTCSTVLLLISGFFSSRLVSEYQNDRVHKLKKALGITLLLGTAFAICQYIGWLELQESGIYFAGKASGSFLYVISGLHALHLVVGLGFLAYLFFYTTWVSKDAVRTLIMVTNPYQKIKLQMFSTYWLFLDALWLTLFFYFLFAY